MAKPHSKTITAWVSDNTGRLCACGCGASIPVTRVNHCVSRGIPQYRQGHNFRREGLAPETVQWVSGNQGKHFCACGCNQPIRITYTMKRPSVGIPTFIRGHSRRKHPYVAYRLHSWTKLYQTWRQQVIQLKGRKCERCGKETKGGQGKDALHVHHEMPERTLLKKIAAGELSPGMLTDPTNGTILCGSCHLKVHRAIRAVEWLKATQPRPQ